MGNARNNILLNPGPVNLSQAVKQAMNHEDVCHREIEFGELVQSINERLIKIYPSFDTVSYTHLTLPTNREV